MQPGITRTSYRSEAPSMLKDKKNVVQVVLGFDIKNRRRVSMLFKNRGGRENRFQAVSRMVPDDSTERAQRFALGFPVVGERAEKLLDLPRRFIFLNDRPLFDSKGLAAWSEGKFVIVEDQ